jgi:hypothetical protein
VCFIVSRLLFVNAVNRFGGYNVAIACMATEVLGLALLWLAPSRVGNGRRRADRLRPVAGVPGAGRRGDQAGAQQ